MYLSGLTFEDELGLEAKYRDYRKVPLEEIAKEEYAHSTHAAHCMIFSKNDRPVLNAYNSKATVIMQMRFDGYLGFPGGVVDAGETPEEALSREIEEEMGLLRQNFKIFSSDHVVTHYSPDKDLFLHFFTKELSMPRLESIEMTAIRNDSFGDEVMGIVRVPLYTMSDGYRGFPAFLSHSFVGNSKQQLLYTLKAKNILTEDEIDKALCANPKMIEGRRNKPE